MTEVEKEFIEYVKSHNPDFSVSLVRLALKLIARYPQVLAEKVWEGNIEDVGIDQNFPLIGEVPMSWKTVQIFMKEGEKK